MELDYLEPHKLHRLDGAVLVRSLAEYREARQSLRRIEAVETNGLQEQIDRAITLLEGELARRRATS